MSTPIVCPSCNASYEIDDKLRGQRILCRKCEKRIDVPAGHRNEGNNVAETRMEPELKPARRRSRDDDGDDRASSRRDRIRDDESARPSTRQPVKTTQRQNRRVMVAACLGLAAFLLVVLVLVPIAGYFVFRQLNADP